ncbi:MAG: PilT/PilU family type 4a pilus ATPase [Deltaproteobacteria bacterium]|nr:PilT/PilU family type 4a pilus ATPase [Deltaproteobacteria bacterium]
MELDRILKVAVRGGASDVLLKTGVMPRFRFNGDIIQLSDGQEITVEIMSDWVTRILPAHLRERLEKRGDADFAYQTLDGNRFRGHVFKQRQTFSLVFRVITQHIRSMEELQLPKILKRLSDEKRGLVLVTGATGSGKSTTLAAMVQRINKERSTHIVTIEDPIEFLFADHMSTIQQREIGIDAESFATALHGAMRQNPDVILVGELRDQNTIETALMAAETGHLVLSTLHTTDAAETLTRMLSYFPPHQHEVLRQMMASTLKAVISQRLVTRIDGKARVAAFEILVNNATVRDHILKNGNFEDLHGIIGHSGEAYGMQTFDDSLLALFKAGVISAEQALAQATKRDNMHLKMRGVGT